MKRAARALLVLALGPRLASAEPIANDYQVVVRDRPLDPFADDTRLVLDEQDIAELGVSNLAEALDQVPQVYVRASGRGGVQADVRGGRKGSLLVRIDGVPISDPFFGTFDLSSIPSTDIVEIRISQTPASPLAGPGGSGGVIDVRTRAPAGPAAISAFASHADAPSAALSATGKGTIDEGWALRASAAGDVGQRSIPTGAAAHSQDQRRGSANLLLEHHGANHRLRLGGGLAQQRFFVPSGEEAGSDLLRIDDETWLGATLSAELYAEDWQGGARAFAQSLSRDALRYPASDLSRSPGLEHVRAERYGLITQASHRTSDALRFDASATLIGEHGIDSDRSLALAEGSSLLAQLALGARASILPWLSAEGAVGGALPLIEGDGPWPEAKLSLTASATIASLRLTGARKGRLPTLRELYQLNTGDPALAPEQSSALEAQLEIHPIDDIELTLAAHARWIDGLIRFAPQGVRLANAGDVAVRGVEGQVHIAQRRPISGGASYAFADARSEVLGDAPLDFFPRHRGELWLSTQAPELGGAWARARYLGARFDAGQELTPVLTLDAGAWWRYDRAQLTLRIENLLDQSYDARAGVPAFGRTIWVGAQVHVE